MIEVDLAQGITNLAAGISGAKLSHAEVIATGEATAERFARLIERSIPHLVAELGR